MNLRAVLSCFFIALLSSSAYAKVYFQETFDDASWKNRWVQSQASRSDGHSYGKFELSHGKFYGDEKKDLGIKTSQDAHFYALTSKMSQPFTNKDKDLVLQFTVKHEQNIDCGGGYIKLLPEGIDQKNFNGDAPYNIMFGPDICGSDKKTHVIITYGGKNHLIEKPIKPQSDELTHVYTLVITPNQKYQVYIDMKEVAQGSIEEDWKILPAKKIKDPKASKPEGWDERQSIDDPSDVMPTGYDDIPKTIPDPEAEKPKDWDDEMDGEYEAPHTPNPEYKGDWKPKQIDNPAFKGKWVHPEIDNPEYTHDPHLYSFTSAYVAFDLWQVKAGSIFDNILVADSFADAQAFYDTTTKTTIEGEKKMKEADAEAKAKEAAASKPQEDDDNEEEEEEDDFKDEL